MTATSPTLHLVGVGLWMPGCASWDAFARGEIDASVTEPPCEWVGSRLLRGSSRLTRMLIDVAAQACAAGRADPSTVSTIYSSQFGEVETMVTLLSSIFGGDGQLSPMRFKNSVHNAAGGLASIGTSNRGFSTSLAAAERSFEAALLEAWALVHEHESDVVIAVADDAIPEPIRRDARRTALGVGVCLRAAPGPGTLATHTALRREDEAAALPSQLAGRLLGAGIAENPASALLPLIAAARGGEPSRVPLAFGAARPYSVLVTPV